MLTVLVALGLGVSVVYASPDGVDDAAGTVKAPTTLPKAVERANGGQPIRKIVLLPGDYLAESTLRLGKSAHDLQIVAQKPGTVRILGGRMLTRWRPAREAQPPRMSESALAHAWVCRLEDEGIADPGKLEKAGFGIGRGHAPLELYTGGKRMTLARYPNQGWAQTAGPTTDTSFSLVDDRPSRWATTVGAWVMGYWQYDWAEMYAPVAGVNGKVVTLGEKTTYGIGPDRRFYWQNVPEELDSPGEYYVDTASKTVTFWSPDGKRPTDVLASVNPSPLLAIDGARNVVVSGLELLGGRSGAVQVSGGEGSRVKDCYIHGFGEYGVSISGAVRSGVSGCDLTELGTSAIELTGGDRVTLVPAGLYAEDNHLWNFAQWCRTYHPGISINGVGNRIVHNTVHDAPHNAILLSGNDHLIELNDIYRVCQETGDSGAVYMGRNPAMRGTVIRLNRFHDMGTGLKTERYNEVMSVYLDDCWCGTTIEENIFEGPGTGVMIGGGRDNIVRGNLFFGKTPAIHLDARGKGWAKNMFNNEAEWQFPRLFAAVKADQPPYTTRYPHLAKYMSDDPAFPKGNVIEGNKSFGGEWLRLLDGLTTKDFVDAKNEVQPKVEDGRNNRAKVRVGAFGVRTKSRPSDGGKAGR